MHFDEVHDMVYVVMAKIDVVNGDTQITVKDLVKINAQVNLWGSVAKKAAAVTGDNYGYEKEVDALKMVNKMTVIFELTM
jgi:hypothetical protein